MNLNKKLSEDTDNINPRPPKVESRGVHGWDFGDEPRPEAPPEPSPSPEPEADAGASSDASGLDLKVAIGVTLVGAIAGSVLYHAFGKNPGG
jgi:hypothetical protein